MSKFEAERLARVAPKIMGAFHHLGRKHSDGEHLTMRQYQAMIITSASGQLSISDFCKQLGLAASTGTELANRMVESGYLKKTQNGPDRRQSYLVLSDDGEQVLRKRQNDMIELFDRLLEPLEDKEQKVLTESFETIWQILGKYYNHS